MVTGAVFFCLEERGEYMAQRNRKSELFLSQSKTWEGTFRNFVNRAEGVIQEGYIVVDVEVDDCGEIRHRNTIMDQNRKPSDYAGLARFRVDGVRLINLEVMSEDPNTKNRIQDHRFDGYVIDDHIFILETYEEVFPDGSIDQRRNHMHYFFPTATEIVMLGDIHVNDELLVFAGTTLVAKDKEAGGEPIDQV